MPRVSIITPCYNQSRYLLEAVESVVAQHYRDWELIIVDDGSPDDTVLVAERIIARYPERAIRLLRQSNTGLAGARNAGIVVAHGEIILPLDADDMLDPQMLARTVPIFDQYPEVGFVYTDVRLFGSETGVVRNRPFDAHRMRITCLLHAVSPFRRIAWEAAGGYRKMVVMGYEDWDFWMTLLALGWQGRHVPEALVRYRRTPGSMLTNVQQHDLEVRALIVDAHPTLYEPGFRRWANRVLAPTWSVAGTLLPGRWWPAFLSYNLLVARYAPGDLPRTLLHPLFWRIPAAPRTALRAFARRILR